MGIIEIVTGPRVSMAGGDPVTRRNDLDFTQGASVTDESGVTRIAVTQEYLNVTDAAVMGTPMVGDGATTGQGALLQAAVDMARGPIFIPKGRYIMGDFSVEQPDAQSVTIIGAEKAQGSDAATVLDFSALGTDKIAIDFNAGATWNLKDLAVVSSSGTYAVGTDVNDCDGLRFNGRGWCEGVFVSGFRSGALVINDHFRITHSTFDGNAYGLNWFDPDGALGDYGEIGLGDIVISFCSVSHNAKAGVAIHSSNSMANVLIEQTHFGNGPYCFWRYGDMGGYTMFMNTISLVNNSYESYGNGLIVDSVGDGRCAKLEFHFYNEANGLTGGARWPGKSVKAAIDVDEIYDVKMFGGQVPFVFSTTDTGGLDDDGTTPIARTAIRSNVKERIWFDTTGAFGDFVTGDGQFLSDGDSPNEALLVEMESPGALGRFRRVAEGSSVTQFDLLERVSATRVRPYQGGFPAGFAAQTRTAGESLPIAYSGFSGGLIRGRIALGHSVTSGDLLKPDPVNNGCVMAATSVLDGPIVAVADSAVTGPGNVEIEVFGS